jgi:hypothetical protein
LTPFEQTPGRGLLLLLDHPDDLAARLEEELVGPGLLEVVRDLETVRSDVAAAELSAGLTDRIVARGLVGLSEQEFQAVLERPRALLNLHKVVLLSGSAYWDAVMRRADDRQEPVTTPAPVPSRKTWFWASHALTASVAAAIVAGVLGWRLSEAKDELQVARAANAQLQGELAAHPPVIPADLPGEYVEVSLPDPDDLPGSDPADLPSAPKSRLSGV